MENQIGPVGPIRKVFADDEDKATCSVMHMKRIPPNLSTRDIGCEEGADFYEQGFVLKDFYLIPFVSLFNLLGEKEKCIVIHFEKANLNCFF